MADIQEPTITAPANTVPAAQVSSPAIETSTISSDTAVYSAPNPIVSPAAETVTVPATDTQVTKPEDAAANATGKTEIVTPPITESILGDEKPKEGSTLKEEVKTEAKTEEKVETSKVELPTYEAFTLPENVTLAKEPLDAFSKILGEIEVGKLDHAGMQAAGQKLIDLAAKNTVDTVNRLNDYYVNIHETQKKDWFEASKKDPELGNGDDKVFADIASNLRSSIDNYAGTSEQQKEFRTLMKDTGVGNHPALLRMLNNMQKKIDSYTKEKGNMAVPAQAPAPSKVKPYQSFYGNSK